MNAEEIRPDISNADLQQLIDRRLEAAARGRTIKGGQALRALTFDNLRDLFEHPVVVEYFATRAVQLAIIQMLERNPCRVCARTVDVCEEPDDFYLIKSDAGEIWPIYVECHDAPVRRAVESACAQ